MVETSLLEMLKNEGRRGLSNSIPLVDLAHYLQVKERWRDHDVDVIRNGHLTDLGAIGRILYRDVRVVTEEGREGLAAIFRSLCSVFEQPNSLESGKQASIAWDWVHALIKNEDLILAEVEEPTFVALAEIVFRGLSGN